MIDDIDNVARRRIRRVGNVHEIVSQVAHTGLLTGLAIVVYVGLRETSVITGGSVFAGIALAAALVLLSDHLLERFTLSPTNGVASLVGIVSVFPLILGLAILHHDDGIPLGTLLTTVSETDTLTQILFSHSR